MARKPSSSIKRSSPIKRTAQRAIIPLEDSVQDEVSRSPSPTAEEWDWQLQAACRGMDSSWFFPPDREQAKARSSRLAKAKAVCARCPAMAECRDFALDNGELFGVWGGLSEDDRVVTLRNSPEKVAAH